MERRKLLRRMGVSAGLSRSLDWSLLGDSAMMSVGMAVARGLGNREIARELFISEATVKTHLVHVYTKLDVESRTAAVARARDEGLIA